MDTRMTPPFGTLESALLVRLLPPNWLQMPILEGPTNLTALITLDVQRMSTAHSVFLPSALMFHSRFGAQLLTTKTTVMSQRLLTWCTHPQLLRSASVRLISSSCVTARLSECCLKRSASPSSKVNLTPSTTRQRRSATLKTREFLCAPSWPAATCSRTLTEREIDLRFYEGNRRY